MILLSAAASLLICSATAGSSPYTLVIHKKDNTRIEVKTEDLQKMEFVETPEAPELNPGDTGTVFPPGVTATSGFWDVDKAYAGVLGSDPRYVDDGLMCWACATAGLLQWWLDDYERVYGQPYSLRVPLDETSLFYSTPVMDEFTRSFKNKGYKQDLGIEWFASGPESLTANFNGEIPFKESYEKYAGNFMGIPLQKIRELITYKEMWTHYGAGAGLSYTVDEFKIVLSRDLLDLLEKGPLAVSVVDSSHATTVWGADYVVDDNCNRIITKVYVTENTDPNLHGDYEPGCNVTWGTNRYGSPRMYYNRVEGGLNTPNDISNFTALPTWDNIQITW